LGQPGIEQLFLEGNVLDVVAFENDSTENKNANVSYEMYCSSD